MTNEDLTLRNDVTGALIACNRYTGGSNDKIVQVIIETCKQANAAAEFRNAVTEALTALRAELREIVATPQNFSTPALQSAIDREIDATIAELGLNAAKEESK